MSASNAQVQAFVDNRIRPRCEQVRALVIAIADDIAVIDDIYAALNVQSPTWADGRTDSPPHLAAPTDVLAINSLLHAIQDAVNNSGQYPIAQKLCVRPATL